MLLRAANSISGRDKPRRPAKRLLAGLTDWLMFVILPGVWIGAFLVSKQGRFPRDLLFGTFVYEADRRPGDSHA